jgi:putative ABC transport system ATP-binding protein
MDMVALHDIEKTYRVGDIAVAALRGVSLSVAPGDFIAIMGASGSGKSTLMNIIGCLDRPTGGRYSIEGIRVDEMTPGQLADIRNQKIGFVFQGYNLLPRTSALDNVELPLLYDRKRRFTNPRQRCIASLERVGLGNRLDHDPSQLSGGQQQRVAIARALVNEPSLVLADEPTGNLDSRTSVEVMAILQELNEQGITIILVTHEDDIAQYARRVVTLKDGLINQERLVDHRRSARSDFLSMPGA